MPAFGLHFPGDPSRPWERIRMEPDDKLLHDELTKRDARLAWQMPRDKPLKQEPRFSLKEVGTFHFHNNHVLGDGSALLLNMRGVKMLHKGRQEQIDVRSKYPSTGGPWTREVIKNTKNVGDKVWAPYHVLNSLDIGGYQRSSDEYKGKYYPCMILSGSSYGGLCERVLVEFAGGQQCEVHIADIRDTPPPERGRGGDKRPLCNFTIWAPPFRRWKNDEIKVEIKSEWSPGEKLKRIVGGLEVEFTLPKNLEKLPWNREKTTRCFTLKMPAPFMDTECEATREWDELNLKAEKQLDKYPMKTDGSRRLPIDVEQLYGPGEGKMFEDSAFMHYRANLEKANPDGTIILSFKNGYTIYDYNPEWISDDQLDGINYRAPRNGIPYNPPEFEKGEYVDIDYDRLGRKAVSSVILEKNENGSYKTKSRFREWSHHHKDYFMGKEVIDEETAHDIIYKEVNKDWGFRSGNPLGKVIPPMDPDTERKQHLKYGRDRVPHNSASKIIGGGLEKYGILAWATWFTRSEKDKNINITQMSLGHHYQYGGMKPTIFSWTTRDEHGASSPKYEWIPLKTITENDVKGIPLLASFYKKALKIHGGEEGNGCLFASYFMEFAEGREKKTLRRWRPQEFETEEDSLEKTHEERQYDLLLSANVRLEENNREMKEIIMRMDEKIKLLENRGEPINRSPRHEFDDYKDWTREAINRKVGDSNKIISEKVEKNKEESFRLITNIAMVCAGACVIETIMKYW